jgi:hypothetical protein
MYSDPSLILDACYNHGLVVSTPAVPARVGGRVVLAARMPIFNGQTRPHRTKDCAQVGAPYYVALVARPVGRAEIAGNPAASQAMNHEWRD